MPLIESITVEGFKSIKALRDLKLGQINVVIGANGAGKSNFIGLFSFLGAIRDGRLQRAVVGAGGADGMLHFGTRVTDTLRIHVVFEGEVNQYEIVLVPTAGDTLRPVEERVFYWKKEKFPHPVSYPLTGDGREAGVITPPANLPAAAFVARHLARLRVYHFHDTGKDSPFKKTASIADSRALHPDGGNLAAFLYRLRENFPESYQQIRATIGQVAPFFDDFHLEPDAFNPEVIRLEWRHRQSDAYFNAAAFSDGSLRFVALATLLLQPVDLRPSVILIDEPELGLHPFAIKLLAALIRQAAVDTQVIVATQSSLLLDNFDPAEILVARQQGGGTLFDRLDTSALQDWLDEYSLGELWEKGELGGRPGGGGR